MVRVLLFGASARAGNLFTYLHDSMGTRDVTLAYDEAEENIGSGDVTLAYDDEAKDSNDIMDVTLAYDDFRYKECLQERIN